MSSTARASNPPRAFVRITRLILAAFCLILAIDWFLPPRRQVLAHAAIQSIYVYQATFGRVIAKYHLAQCKFTPTCSNYGILAYKKYGTFKGTYLTARRLARCSPFSSARGVDRP